MLFDAIDAHVIVRHQIQLTFPKIGIEHAGVADLNDVDPAPLAFVPGDFSARKAIDGRFLIDVFHCRGSGRRAVRRTQPNPKRHSVLLGLLRRREQPAFGPLGAGRFNPVNRRRDSFHCVALATLEHAVLESSDTGVYSLQVHAFPALRARRTFGRQQLRQSTSAHGCTPSQLRLYSIYQR